ncbi:PA14 domain-containing protein [Tenacibaculum sp. M341]|uniref:PA14 domain-containing protein n=1 Tax=Tenacibaculum sp. M341 TaxID=2530339 RepID=UPI0014052E11|nr:PA14 domain-containing protein [Tenacibaculum sp. M341]
MKTKALFYFFFISFQLVFSQIDADSVMGVPTVANSTEMNSVTGANTGSIVYNIAERGIYMFDGTNWISTSSNNWLINGNTGTTNANFLGTIDDVKMEIRSNNTPMLEFGRRGTLNLDQTFLDYDDVDQPLVHLNGNGTISALQFAAAGANFYKPMFFTTPNGSFRLKGSSGGTDFFEIGSGGNTNNGRLDIIIADDGAEPISFKRFDYRNQSYRELFRVQGHANVADAKTRFGININPNYVAVDPTYNESQAGFNIANSTLQVQGSISKSIETVSANLTLTEDHHTILVTSAVTITLPAANTCTGRVYVIKNSSGNNLTLSNYVDSDNNNLTSFNGKILWLQSDGTNWQQINRKEISDPGLQYYTWNIANTTQPNIDNVRSLGQSTSQGITNTDLNDTSRGTIAPDTQGYILLYKGTLNVNNTGDFTFNGRSDDGTRIYIDDVLVLENWFDQGATTRSATINLAKGEHKIEFWYYENAGGDFMQFTWGANPDGYTVNSVIQANQFSIK